MPREGFYSSSIEVIECCHLKGLGEYMLKHEDLLREQMNSRVMQENEALIKQG